MNEEIKTEKDFLQIKAIRTSSNAFVMKLAEGDIIIALDGLIVNKSYDDLTKELNEIEDKKILTLYRDGVFFNTFVYGSLGVICESVNSNTIPDLKKLDPNDYFNQDDFYFQFEVYKKPQKTAILLNTFPTILASLAPPLWMLQNRLWTFLCISLVFYWFLLMISPWFFFIGWILKSWHVGNSQIDILRFFYRMHNYRLSLSFCAKSEKEAQETARRFDDKVDFNYSYLEPVALED